MPNYNPEKNYQKPDIVPDGEYEVRILKAEIAYTKTNNKKHIFIDFVIRDDIDQPSTGRHFYERMFPNKDTGEFSTRICSVFQCCGAKEEYADVVDHLEDLYLQCCRIVTGHRFDDYRGEDVAFIKYFKPSAEGVTTAPEVHPDTGMQRAYTEDNDLPF